MSTFVRAALEWALEHANLVTAGFLACALLFLVGACHAGDSWWLLFNLLFLLLGAIPAVFGSYKSGGVWGAIGDFCIGIAIVSIFAYPTVLRNNNAWLDDDNPYALAILSDVFFTAAIFLNLARLHQYVVL